MGEKRFSAVEARRMSDASEKFINRAYKLIKDSCTELGITSLNYGVFGVSEALLERLIKELKDNGYKTELHYGPSEWDEAIDVPETLTISW